ncbi:retention module-containing protein, partial [Marinomonas aquiplantarum]
MSDNQVSFATLGDQVGVITKLSGSVVVESIDGQERVVKVGDPVFFGEVVRTGNNGSVTIAFADGTEVQIGNDANVEINDEIYNSGSNEDLVADSSSDVDALQQAILSGDDPTLIQEAPAAGETPSEQDRVDVEIERNDNSALPGFGSDSLALPTYGYDTDNGFGSNLRNTANTTISESTSNDSVEDTVAEAGTVTIDTITLDDQINASEALGLVSVTGTAAGGDISTGDTVTLVIAGNTYTTTVQSDSTWSVDVDGMDLVADTEFDAVVLSADEAGNTVESVGSSTHTVDDSELLVNLDIDPITEDSVINAAEASTTVTVTGTVTGDSFETGTVTLVINDVNYTADVNDDGTWSVDVAGTDLAADSDTEVSASVTVSNSIGQEGTAATTEAYFIDTSARASIRVNSITSDDVISADESASTVTVSGRVGFDASAGDIVTMTIGGTLYTAEVQANKTWSVEVAGSDLAADTSFDVTVIGEDASGNPYSATTTSTHTVDLAAEAGTVTVNNITEDDVINAAESAQTIAVTGTATGGDIASGDTVTLVINDTEYTTTVGADGTWTVDVEGSDLAADTEFDAVVSSEDAAGNTVNTTGSSEHTVDLVAEAGTVTVNNITEDDVINATESAQTIAVTGTATGGDIAEGDTVTLEINGQTYTTQVAEDGTWTVDVAGSDLAADTDFDAVVSSEDAAGNTVDTTGSSEHTVDLVAEAGTVTVNNITEDDVINASESAQTIAVTGTATGGDIAEGDTVTLVINNTTYTTTVGADGTWTVDVAGSDLAADTEFDAVVTSSDEAGNNVQTTGSSEHTVDLVAEAGTVTVNNITEDDVINATESAQTIAVTGTATGGDIAEGDTVTLVINNTTYTTTVGADGTWTVDVEGSDLAADTEFDAVVTSSDEAGNNVQTTGSSEHTVDLVAEAGTVTVNNITEDDVINATESAQTIAVTGTATGGDIAEGDTVTLVINNTTYTTTVGADGTWTVDVEGSDLAADTEFDAVVSSEDAAGNTVNTTGSSTHTVDTEATAGTVTVNNITEDDVINATESAQTIAVTGTATGGDIAEGDTVTLVINNTTYTTTVGADGTWTVDVEGSDLAADTEFDAVVSSEDAAGNTVNTTGSSEHTVDLVAEAGTVTVNNITEDDVINAAESAQTIAVTGT